MALSVVQVESHDRTEREPMVQLRGVTWADYQRLLELRGDRSSPRLTYLEGVLEIMSPSRKLEALKSLVGRLVEVWCLENGVAFSAYGSWTLESKSDERGAEPDECYVFGEEDDPQRPDLAIEVVWTSGGLDKLDVYGKLRVREVWFWRQGALRAHALRGASYEEIEGSEVLPNLDLAKLASFLDRPTTSRAIHDYAAALRSSRTQ